MHEQAIINLWLVIPFTIISYFYVRLRKTKLIVTTIFPTVMLVVGLYRLYKANELSKDFIGNYQLENYFGKQNAILHLQEGFTYFIEDKNQSIKAGEWDITEFEETYIPLIEGIQFGTGELALKK